MPAPASRCVVRAETTSPLANDPNGVTIGVDVGGTKTHAAAFDDDFRPVADLREPTGTGGTEVVGRSLLDTLARLESRLDGARISTIGLGIPGLVDVGRGTVRQAVNLGIGSDPLDLVDLLTAVYSVPCRVDNDVNAAALGAFRVLGDDVDISDLAYLSIGTGIAAGVVLDGRLHRGHRGVAGEIGHFPMTVDGMRCECGLRGCLETVASGPAIGRRWPVDGGAPAEALLTAATGGDASAVEALEPIADHLAMAVYLLAITYDVDLIVVGGGVAEVGPMLLDAIRDGIDRLQAQSGFVRSLDLGARVVLKPAAPIGAIGAAALTRAMDP